MISFSFSLGPVFPRVPHALHTQVAELPAGAPAVPHVPSGVEVQGVRLISEPGRCCRDQPELQVALRDPKMPAQTTAIIFASLWARSSVVIRMIRVVVSKYCTCTIFTPFTRVNQSMHCSVRVYLSTF